MPYSALVDAVERESRKAKAESLVPGLAEAGVVAVATTFVDNSGITRVKSVPLDRLPHLAAWGVGASTSFDFFRFDDWLAAPPDGRAPVGDLRVIPDLARVVPLAAQPGWAWAPGERYRQDGQPHPLCSRLLLARQTDSLAAQGLQVLAAFEIEWVISTGGEDFTPGVAGPGYGMTRLIEASDYARDLLEALARQGVAVEQFHPEYATGQLELSVAAGTPVEAADTSVLVRSTIRAVGAAARIPDLVLAEGGGGGGRQRRARPPQSVARRRQPDGGRRRALRAHRDRCGLRRRHPRPVARPAGDRGAFGGVLSPI